MAQKKISLRMRGILFVMLIMLGTNLLLGTVLMNQMDNATKTQINERMLDVVNTAASMLDGDTLVKLRAEDKGSPEYQQVYDTLARFMDNVNLDYVYYVRDMGNKEFTFGIDTDPKTPADFGDPVVYTEALFKASQGTPAVDEKPYEDRWGRFYSAFSPVFTSDGKVAGVVTADFDAKWYETQINKTERTIFLGCLLFLIIGIGVAVFMNSQYTREMEQIRSSMEDLAEDLDSLTREFAEKEGPESELFQRNAPETDTGDIRALGQHLSELRDNLRRYLTHSTTQANSMITAMASDYRAVFYVNLDKDEGVCYRSDPDDEELMKENVHFRFREKMAEYAEKHVAEGYRDGFRIFTDPDNIRNALMNQPIIAYRYLAVRDGHEYYEMLRIAGVRRVEEREDHVVHAIGIGLTVIDEEMRETMSRNEALAEALALAEDANNAKTAFLSSMSHEIRTPMNAIIGLDNLALHEENLPPQTRDYLEKIGESAHHLLSLINDILDMSRIESGKIVLQREEFSFSGMLEQINTMVMSQCSDKGLHYECRILGKVNDYYIGDDTKLKEVLINILSNAIKFTEAPGSVTLTVERTAEFEEQSTLRFRIKDTGIGIDKDYIPKIFDAFSQEDSSRKTKYGSTGLGMAITRNIVEMMNGTIEVESEKGVGTEFTVTVTLRDCNHHAGDTVDPGSLRVLVVDDESFAAEHARMVLDEAGIRADVCSSGQEALHMMELQHLKNESYNLVLLDWQMPEMDGVETARQIRERYDKETTIIILTAYNWDEILEESRKAGVDGFLAKPLFASNVVNEFQRVARRNNMNLFKEKKRASLEGRRILLAEDIEINADIMMDILEMEGAETDHAENGRIVVDMFAESAPGTYSAVLMDVRMPEMDGLEATAAIRGLNHPDAKRIPIIALTANAFDEDVQRSLQAGMNAHLTKPVEADHLYQTLEELIY